MSGIITIILMVWAVVLQMYLSRKPSRWPGLVLPIISFLFSLLYPLSMADMGGDRSALIAQLLLVWLLANIPTFIFLAIYFSARGRLRRAREFERMDAQDLG